VTIPDLIHIIAFDEASSKPQEQNQDPKEPILFELVTLQRSMREEKYYSR